MLDSDDFDKFVQTLFSLCVYMLLHDPPLRVPLDNFKNRKYEYRRFKKNEFICIDGFAKEKAPSLVILPAVCRNTYSYNGIKPSVIILQDDFVTKPISKKLKKLD